jgi:hypothetical protein
MSKGVPDLHYERAVVGQLRYVDDDGAVREIDNGVPVDGEVVGGDDEPVYGRLQPVELLEAVVPNSLRLKGLWEASTR